MSFCTSCGEKNQGDAKFCTACGKPVGGTSSPSSGASTPSAQVNKCPACRAPIESFQTRCSSCGTELGSAESGESVKSFFKKLDDITEREYEANKKREKETGKKKRKQSTPLKVLEFIAVLSFILLLLHLTGINNMLTGADKFNLQVTNTSGSEITVLVFDKELDEIEYFEIQNNEYKTVQLYRNYYLVRVIDSDETEYHYPPDGKPENRDGDLWLTFNGRRLSRD
ncbi:MAG: zinc ribbon domain-containing protein [Treponema sp.]|nr:zinc ribbon domain-containing protein [Treponema sp.]